MSRQQDLVVSCCGADWYIGLRRHQSGTFTGRLTDVSSQACSLLQRYNTQKLLALSDLYLIHNELK